MRSFEVAFLVGIAALVSLLSCHRQQETANLEALKEFQNQVDSTLPSVALLTGIPKCQPVKVNLLTRKGIGDFFETTLKVEYPDEELKKRGRCLALMGLLPEGYDLEYGFVKLLKQQAGAVYDLRSKTVIGISDLDPERRRAINDNMILSHELTHALQDCAIDIVQESEIALENIDYEYALRAVLEGMASSVMIAHAQNMPYGKLPDLQKFWRSQLSQASGGTLEGSPRYVSEYLMSPYAEGGAFVQWWQKKNPDKTLKDLLERIPASSEQVLHFEKYTEGDEPTTIDLSRAHDILPERWKLMYANTLGEFELLVLFQIYEETQTSAAVLAAGWDGCRFEAYEDRNGGLILLGSSAWDSEKDAAEFCEGFGKVLGKCRPGGDQEVVQVGARAGFLIGSDETTLRTKILRACVADG